MDRFFRIYSGTKSFSNAVAICDERRRHYGMSNHTLGTLFSSGEEDTGSPAPAAVHRGVRTDEKTPDFQGSIERI
jgi:hypothetical protein